MLGFYGEPLTSALLSAALTLGVEFVEVPVLSVDGAPVTVAHRDENAFGSVDELRCCRAPCADTAVNVCGTLAIYRLDHCRRTAVEGDIGIDILLKRRHSRNTPSPRQAKQ